AYMGPAEARPPEPEIEWALLPDAQVFVSKRLQESNYLQALEGGIDSSHVSFTHKFNLDDDPFHRGSRGNEYLKRDGRPRFEVVESDGGLLIAHAWVPIDDETCWAWSINYHPVRDLAAGELADMRAGGGIHCTYEPGTFRPAANRANDYLIDRDAQRAKRSFSGVKGIAMQDASLQESMGRIQDRRKERLGTSDAAIIMARQRLLRAAKALAEGEAPPGLQPDVQRVRSASLLLPKHVPFQDGAADALRLQPRTAFVSL
ncbi:MAG: aromatic ring-hydroxylating dioxygenase subunit alpha, partial [Candidatus Velthaea sp.]